MAVVRQTPVCTQIEKIFGHVWIRVGERSAIHSYLTVRSSFIMTSLTLLPNELIYEMTRYLDVISITRLTWVSSALHNKIGLSKSFWLRYCRLLLEDELLPSSCFRIENLGLNGLVRLATRKERLARVTHASQQSRPLPAQRTQFYLGHGPRLNLKQSSTRVAPGGRWIIGLAWHYDFTTHVLCWDAMVQRDDDLTTIPPITSAPIEPCRGRHTTAMLGKLWYDPDSESYCTLVIWSALGRPNLGCKALLISMKCTEDHQPSFYIHNQVTTWPDERSAELKYSTRWAVIHSTSAQPIAAVWDLASGRITNYPLEPHTVESFHTFVVTRRGTVFDVRGTLDGGRLVIRCSNASSGVHPSSSPSETIDISGTAVRRPTLANRCLYRVIPHEEMRLLEGQMATTVQVLCETAEYSFSVVLAISQYGKLYQLPLTNELWRLNEHIVPLWMTYPASSFILGESANSQGAGAVVTDDKGLFLFAIPHNLYNPGAESAVSLFAIPTSPSDIGDKAGSWSCTGICPRSGSWVLVKYQKGGRLVATIIRAD
ncbi:hypothetical protein DL93DRAFT_722663 [Clavulina sp. PMI_390]|nr:hypothetical protein DL93DRAFT_722663 [Clavulina sp. PMI_390]